MLLKEHIDIKRWSFCFFLAVLILITAFPFAGKGNTSPHTCFFSCSLSYHTDQDSDLKIFKQSVNDKDSHLSCRNLFKTKFLMKKTGAAIPGISEEVSLNLHVSSPDVNSHIERPGYYLFLFRYNLF